MARDERLERVLAAMADTGVEVAVLTTIASVAYAGGYAAPVEWGPSPFAGGPATLLVTKEGETTLVTANIQAPSDARVDHVVTYPGFSAVPYTASLAEEYRRSVAGVLAGIAGAAVGHEPETAPAALAELLGAARAIGDATARARVTKTAAEVEQLRACAGLVGVGLDAARDAARAGRSELDLFADIRSALEHANGGRTSVAGDLLTGRVRTFGAMGTPGLRQLSAGDPVLVDLVPWQHGYWGDGATTFSIEPSASGFARMHAACAEALARGAEVLRPGITAGEVDASIRGVLDARGFATPLFMGHGIGLAVHEYPRIVPGDPAVLRPGMVLMLEPFACDPEIGGVRLESMFHLTDTGNEQLSEWTFAL